MIPRRFAHCESGEIAALLEACRAPGNEDAACRTEWEVAVASYVDVRQAAAVNSGRRGMALIFAYLGIGEGDEVIVPAYTLGELIPLIQGLGARVIPADIDPYTLNVTAETIAARITPKTRAILVLHAFGNPCPIEAIVALASERDISVIEDCAHSLGATREGRATGSFGYAGFYSFETTKPINTFGGGMVVSADRGLIDSIHAATANDGLDARPLLAKVKATRTEQRLFRTGLAWPMLYLLATPAFATVMNRLYRRVQHAPPAHVPYTTMQAALGLRKLPGLAARIAARETAAKRLMQKVEPVVRFQCVDPGCRSSWYFLIAILPRAAAGVRKRLLWHGIDAGIEHEIADDVAALLGCDDCPGVREVYSRAIALPLFDGITRAQIDRVATALNRCMRR